MKIIAGLGNPGDDYKNTRHNVGFMFLDAFAQNLQITNWRENFSALVSEAFFNNEKIILVKPMTFMNDSGLAIGQVLNYYKLETSDLAVIHDDMDIPVGAVRIRKKGGAGGHNGIKSILEHTPDENFMRFRIGIGHPDKISVIKHVLSPFNEDEREKVNAAIKSLIPALECAIETDIDMAMNKFNPKKEKKDKKHE